MDNIYKCVVVELKYVAFGTGQWVEIRRVRRKKTGTGG